MTHEDDTDSLMKVLCNTNASLVIIDLLKLNISRPRKIFTKLFDGISYLCGNFIIATH